MKMFKNASMLLAGLAALMLSVAAQAGTIPYDSYKLKYGTHSEIIGSITESPTTGRIYAGEINFFNDGKYAFSGFCIELTQTLKSSGSYNEGSVNGTHTGALGALFEMYYPDANNRVNSAAFQLAIWSILYKDPDSLLTSTFSPDIQAKATSYLEGIKGFTGPSSYSFLAYKSPDTQDMLTWTRVPEPGTLALLGLGLLGAGAIRRRRS